MDGLNPQAWHDIFSVAAGASAALLGLVLVAMSLHPKEMERSPTLRNRARLNIAALGALLTVSLVDLVPDVTAFWFGAALVAVTLGYLLLVISGSLSAYRGSRRRPPLALWLWLSPNLSLLLSIAAGISLMLGKGPGLYLQVPPLVLGLPVVLFNVWELLFAPALHESS